MDLRTVLVEIFPSKDEEKYSRMLDNLRRLGVDSESELKNLDAEDIQGLDSFSRVEIKKLNSYLKKHG